MHPRRHARGVLVHWRMSNDGGSSPINQLAATYRQMRSFARRRLNVPAISLASR